MLVNQVFEAWLFPDPLTALNDLSYPYTQGENITEGILNINIVSGNDIYEGPQQQIDVGQFTIVSRNPNLDPKINPNLKYDSTIKFRDTRTGEFFRGFVTDVQVDYQRNDDPIITITGTDIFGAAQRVVISQETHDSIMALSTGPTWNGLTFTEFLPYMTNFTFKYLDGQNAIQPPGYPYPYGFYFPETDTFGEINVDLLCYSPSRYIPQVGETYLEVITKYAQTNLNSFNANSNYGGPMNFSYIGVTPFVKYNPKYWGPQSDPMTTYTTYDFSSDPQDNRSYESIVIDNGYNRTINQIDISNDSRFVDAGEIKSDTLNLTRTSNESIENYAISTTSVSTIFPANDPLPETSWATNYATNIFQVVQFPAQEIKEITFNNATKEMIDDNFSYSNYMLNRMIRIKHQINNNETIDRVYDIAGITHDIAADNWSMTFILKPAQSEIAFQYQGALPTLAMNATSGDSNFNFTATIQNIDPTKVNQVIWALNAIDGNEMTSVWPYAYYGNMYKNGLKRTGLTQTWNFDDDGILAPYSFDPESIPTDPTDNRYGGYGTGYWSVYAFIQLTNGYTIALQQQLTVGTPEVTANFGWAQNLTNSFGTVQFTDTSVNHETGEPDSYLWDFGDGTTSSERNPLKTYVPVTNENSYSVSLTVFAYGEGGTKVYNTKTQTVTLVQPTMVPDFTYTVLNGTVIFTNTSTNVGFEEPDAYLWDFDDGTTSTFKNPIHTYQGSKNQSVSFDVTLTTRNIWEQTASVTKTISFTFDSGVGDYPVQYIRLISNFYPSGIWPVGKRFTPYMYFFKGIENDTQSNILYLQPASLKATTVPPSQGTTNNIVWQKADGNAETNDPTLSLTRDPSITPISGYGLSPSISSITGTSRWMITIPLKSTTFTLDNFYLNLRDVVIGGSEVLNDPIFVEMYVGNTQVTGDGWTKVGYFPSPKGPVGKTPLGSTPIITETVMKFVPLRNLPINNILFEYTFTGNTRTINFTTGSITGPWLWDFGDGTTSTLQNPVKTFSTNGTHNITLVSNLGTTTDTIYFPPWAGYGWKYVRLKQKLHDGTHKFDTPYIANFNIFAPNKTGVLNILPLKGKIVSRRISNGTAWSPGYTGATTFDPFNTENLTNDTGLRFTTTNANNTSEWDVVFDFTNVSNGLPGNLSRYQDITLDAALASVSGFPPTVASGISYEIFITPYQGTFASATDPDDIGGGSTWTKIGEINPTFMAENILTTYSFTPV